MICLFKRLCILFKKGSFYTALFYAKIIDEKMAKTLAGSAFSEDYVLIFFWLSPKEAKTQGSR